MRYCITTHLARYLYVYYRRTRRLDVPLISDIRVVPEPPPDNMTDLLKGWTKAEGDLHSGVWPSQSEMRIWYRTEDQDWTFRKRQEEVSYDYVKFITEMDVVYGDDEPFYGFQKVEGGPIIQSKEGRWESVNLSYRKGTYSESSITFRGYMLKLNSTAVRACTYFSLRWNF
jgi:hypothetical protein